MTDIETVEMLQNQLSALQQQAHLQFIIIVMLIVALGVTVALLYRSVPPGHVKDVMGLLSPVLRESTDELLKKLETAAPTTDGIVDDAAALAGRAIHNALYPASQNAVPGSIQAPVTATAGVAEGQTTTTAEVTVEVTTEEK